MNLLVSWLMIFHYLSEGTQTLIIPMPSGHFHSVELYCATLTVMMTEATKAKNLTLRPVLGRILLLYLCGFLHMLACAPTVSRDVICVDFLCLGQQFI